METGGVAAEPGNRIAERLAGGGGGGVDHIGGDVAGHHAGAEGAHIDDGGLFADEVHDFEGMRERGAGLADAAGDFEGGDDAHDAVESSSRLNGVYVGSEHKDGAVSGAEASDEVAGGVDARLEASVAEALG